MLRLTTSSPTRASNEVSNNNSTQFLSESTPQSDCVSLPCRARAIQADLTMTGNGSNRYALFVTDDDFASPKSSPVVDVSRNPFLNQVADDSIPWQEVKKRGAAAIPPPAASKPTILTIRAQAKHAATQWDAANRARTASASTADTTEKGADPHENWCGVCSLKFANKPALLNHIKQGPEHKHYCNLCKRVFKDRNGLKNHLDNSWGHDVFCNLCLSAFNDEWGLKNHFENNYNVGHEFVCLTCLLGFRSRVELDRHLQSAEKHTWCGVRVRSVSITSSKYCIDCIVATAFGALRLANNENSTASDDSAIKMSAMGTGRRLRVSDTVDNIELRAYLSTRAQTLPATRL